MNHLMRRNPPTPSPWYSILLGLNNEHCTESASLNTTVERRNKSSFDFNINILKCVCQRKLYIFYMYHKNEVLFNNGSFKEVLFIFDTKKIGPNFRNARTCII